MVGVLIVSGKILFLMNLWLNHTFLEIFEIIFFSFHLNDLIHRKNTLFFLFRIISFETKKNIHLLEPNQFITTSVEPCILKLSRKFITLQKLFLITLITTATTSDCIIWYKFRNRIFGSKHTNYTQHTPFPIYSF